MTDLPQTSRNRLLVPLIAVSLVCLAEGLVIAFLLGRAPSPPPLSTGYNPPAPNGRSSDSAGGAPATGAAPVVIGKVGQRVDSAGLGVTVVTVSNQPQHGELFKPAAGQKFIDVELLIENNTARQFDYYSSQIEVRDDRDRTYAARQLGAADPALGWGHIVPGEKVRGHLAFVVPADAKGLTLAMAGPTAPADAPAVRIELGQ